MRRHAVTERDWSERAMELRREFDATFAKAPLESATVSQDFLMIRVSGEPFAIRVRDIGRVTSASQILAVPTRRATVLGVVAIRGVIVAVHSLARLLGHASNDMPKWIAIAAGTETTGLAFDELERFVRIHNASEERVLVHDGLARPIVDVAAILESIHTKRKSEA